MPRVHGCKRAAGKKKTFMKPCRLLAISGSLRKQSYNSALLEALSQIAPAYIEIRIFKTVGDLPLFNPDREAENIPALLDLTFELQAADGLIIASPEYAHGISGAMKNLLDWLVSGEEFVNKPVVLFNTSPRAHHAQDALREVITTMSGRIIEPASIAVALLGTNFTAAEIAARAEFSDPLLAALAHFYKAIQ